MRAGGQIGSGLNAEVSLYADGELLSALQAVGGELRFWFMTSEARAAPLSEKTGTAIEAQLESGETLWLEAVPTTHAKCERCWHQRADVGTHALHPTLCGRCVNNIADVGEIRLYI